MVAAHPQGTGVLVVRIWVEGDPPGRMRARVTQVFDIAQSHEVVQFHDTAEEVLDAVRAWLDAFLRGQPDSSRGG